MSNVYICRTLPVSFKFGYLIFISPFYEHFFLQFHPPKHLPTGLASVGKGLIEAQAVSILII